MSPNLRSRYNLEMHEEQKFPERVLDCTLRDGGYKNGWNFSVGFANALIESLGELGVNYIELGFIFPEKFVQKHKLGPFAQVDQTIISKLKKHPHPRYGVMVNATEFSPKQIWQEFRARGLESIDFVRIATHHNNMLAARDIAVELKGLGVEIMVNIMQSHGLSHEDLRQICHQLKSVDLSAIYLADSAGSMYPSSTEQLLKVIREETGFMAGFHGHDNMSMALANANASGRVENHIVDGTLLGIGRGAGNTRIEHLLSQREGKTSYTKLSDLILRSGSESGFPSGPRRDADWLFFLSGLEGIHPNFANSLMRNIPGELMNSVKLLLEIPEDKKSHFVEFETEFDLDWYSEPVRVQTDSQTELLAGPNLNADYILVGPGASADGVVSEICESKDKYGTPVGVLGVHTSFPIGHADFCFLSNPLSIITLPGLELSKETTYVAPFSKVPAQYFENIPHDIRLDFDLSKSSEPYTVAAEGVRVFTHRVFAYAISYYASIGAKRVYLAGFDGYKEDSDLNQEFEDFVEVMSKSCPNVQLLTLTPTMYQCLLPERMRVNQ